MRILAVHHDAGLNGGCLLFQTVLEGLVRDHGATVTSVFPRDGAMIERAAAIGPVTVLDPPQPRRRGRARSPIRGEFDVVFANSAASATLVARVLPEGGPPLVVYVHESQYLLAHEVGIKTAGPMLRRADLLLAASRSVRDALVTLVAPSAEILVVPGFVPDHGAAREGTGEAADALGLVPGRPVVGAVGTITWYKGADLFPVVARRVRELLGGRDVDFVWVGAEQHVYDRAHADHDLAHGDLAEYVRFPGEVADPTPFLGALDVLLLPSREDSWPLVMLEAAAEGVPLVCFRGTGGAEDFVADGAGMAVDYLDVEAMARAVVVYLTDPGARDRAGARAREQAAQTTAAGQTARIAEVLAGVVGSRGPRSVAEKN